MRLQDIPRTATALACCAWLGGAALAPAAASPAPPQVRPTETEETTRGKGSKDTRRQDHRRRDRDHRGSKDRDRRRPKRETVRDHRSGSRETVRDKRHRPTRPKVRDHRDRPAGPPRGETLEVHEAIEIQSEEPEGTEEAEELLRITPRGPILGAGDFPLTSIQDSYWAGADPDRFYYLPRAFHLARDPAGGYGVSAVWTNDQDVLLTLTLRAGVDPAEVEYAQHLVREKEGPSARLVPLPYEAAEIVDLEVMEGWEIEEIKVPSFGSLGTSIPLAIEMKPDSFANLKPLLETEGIGAGVVLTSGEQTHHVDVKISLRYPSGRAYSPIRDLQVGYDPESSELVLDGVTNHLEFPVAVDAVDLELRGPDWPEPEVYSGLRLASPVVLQPRETGRVVVEVPVSERLGRRLRHGHGGGDADEGRRDDESFGEALLREVVVGLMERRGRDGGRNREGTEDRKPERRLVPLDGLAQRYRLRITPDYACQPCYDRIWGDLEVVSYVERLRQLRIEVLEAAFSDSYSGRDLDTVKVDLRSPYLSPEPGERSLLRSVSLTRESSADESVDVYLPRSPDTPLTFEYRLTAILDDGTRLRGSGGWQPMEDSLQVLIGAADIRGLSAEAGGQ